MKNNEIVIKDPVMTGFKMAFGAFLFCLIPMTVLFVFDCFLLVASQM